jgi:hypothetical protein
VCFVHRARSKGNASAYSRHPSTNGRSENEAIILNSSPNQARPFQSFRRTFLGCLLVVAVSLLSPSIFADPIPVHYPEGTIHGFLSLTDADGKVLAAGDLIMIVRGSQVNAHIVYRFKDGSTDDETTVFTQRGFFRLISDHHVQKGPFFPHPVDVTIDVPHSTVTFHTTDKNGKDQAASNHMNLPPDLYNGLIGSIVKNVKPDAPITRVSMIVMAPKPRIVRMAISPAGEDPYTLAGVDHKSRSFNIKIEIGGVEGMIAPLVGKAPPDIQLWVVPGEVPVIVREKAQLFEDSPILDTWMVSPVWPKKSSDAAGN